MHFRCSAGAPLEQGLVEWAKTRRTNLKHSIFVYIYMLAAGFDNLGKLLFSFKMFFLLRIVEDVTSISKSQSLTLVSVKDGHLESSKQNYFT
jgi:hypothetical protein